MINFRGAVSRIVLFSSTLLAIALLSLQPWMQDRSHSASSATQTGALAVQNQSPLSQGSASSSGTPTSESEFDLDAVLNSLSTTDLADSSSSPSNTTGQATAQATAQTRAQTRAQTAAAPLSTASSQAVTANAPTAIATGAVSDYIPATETIWADPTNYGDRYATDAYGNPVYNDFIVVLHETVGSASSAINTFLTYHPRDEDQVSYHTLIRRDGSVVYIVPPEKRAFGAGNSEFSGINGPESVVTNPEFPSSVNNFAYHVSLESPSDGRGNSRTHSGYTDNQYRSLAWLIAQSTVPDDRITTHRAVDRSGNRLDPRSFDMNKFFSLLHQYARPS